MSYAALRGSLAEFRWPRQNGGASGQRDPVLGGEKLPD